MMNALIIICTCIVLTDTLRLSLMKRTASLIWGIVCMLFAFFVSLKFTQLSQPEANELFDIRGICIFGFLENLIFISYLFSKDKVKQLLSYYPGFMILYPISLMALMTTRNVRGISFMAIGIVVAFATIIILSAFTFLFRWLKSDNSLLYIVTIISLIIYTITYGIS